MLDCDNQRQPVCLYFECRICQFSGFSITGAGFLSPLAGTIVGTNPTGSTNLDIAIDGSDKYLYSVNWRHGTSLERFSIQDGGALKLIGIAGGLTANSGLNGIAAL